MSHPIHYEKIIIDEVGNVEAFDSKGIKNLLRCKYNADKRCAVYCAHFGDIYGPQKELGYSLYFCDGGIINSKKCEDKRKTD